MSSSSFDSPHCYSSSFSFSSPPLLFFFVLFLFFLVYFLNHLLFSLFLLLPFPAPLPNNSSLSYNSYSFTDHLTTSHCFSPLYLPSSVYLVFKACRPLPPSFKRALLASTVTKFSSLCPHYGTKYALEYEVDVMCVLMSPSHYLFSCHVLTFFP